MLVCPLAVDWGNIADWAAVTVSLVAAGATVWAVWVALRSSNKEHQRTIQLRNDEWSRQDLQRKEQAATWAITFGLELRRAQNSLNRAISNLTPALKDVRPFEAFATLNKTSIFKEHLVLLRRQAGALDSFPPEIAARLLDVLSWWDQMGVVAANFTQAEGEVDEVTATLALATMLAQCQQLSESIDRQRDALSALEKDVPAGSRRTREQVNAERDQKVREFMDLTPFPLAPEQRDSEA